MDPMTWAMIGGGLLGGLGGFFGGGGGPSQTNTSNSHDDYSWLEPFGGDDRWRWMMNEGQRWYNRAYQPWSPENAQRVFNGGGGGGIGGGLGQILNLFPQGGGGGGRRYNPMAYEATPNEYLARELSDDRLDPNKNEGLQISLDALSREAQQDYQRSMAALNSSMIARGRYGGGSHAAQQVLANEQFNEGLGAEKGRAIMGAYDSERNRQMQALDLLQNETISGRQTLGSLEAASMAAAAQRYGALMSARASAYGSQLSARAATSMNRFNQAMSLDQANRTAMYDPMDALGRLQSLWMPIDSAFGIQHQRGSSEGSQTGYAPQPNPWMGALQGGLGGMMTGGGFGQMVGWGAQPQYMNPFFSFTGR